MAASEDSSSFFPVFILSIIALPLVPFTIFRLFHTATGKVKTNYCRCSLCYSSRKHQNSALKRISRFSTCSNLTVLVLWAIMVILVYHIKQTSYEVQMFEPLSILGLEVGASDSEIKKAYRKLSILYHPDKNHDPEAQNYFVDAISKAYQALTDPTSRENYEKYGHPDGKQGFRIGIALPHFIMNCNRTSGGIVLLGIVGTCILLPLIVSVVYLLRSSKYAENYIMRQTLSTYFQLMKPSLDASKVLDVFIRAEEFSKVSARKSDNEHLQRLFTGIRRELNLGPGKKKAREANFWKQDPCLTKMTVLIQAQLLRESAAIASPLWRDFNCMLEMAPRLLQVLLQIALLPRRPLGHGYLMPAVGVIELSQSIIQIPILRVDPKNIWLHEFLSSMKLWKGLILSSISKSHHHCPAVPLSARKEVEGNSEGIAPFLQLPHFNETVVKKLAREKLCTFQELRNLTMTDRFELLTQTAELSIAEAHNVELVLETMPCMTIDISCQTDGEEGIQEGDIVTMYAWVNLNRRNKLKYVLPHAPYFPFHKEECFWLLLADPISNEVWIARMVSFMDEDASIRSASRQVQEREEALGASIEEVDAAVKSVVEKVKSGSRLVIARFIAPNEGIYNLTAHCLCDSWIGCDAKANLTIDIAKRSLKCSHGCSHGHSVEDGPVVDNKSVAEEENEDEVCEDYDSEYSEDDEDSKNRKDM